MSRRATRTIRWNIAFSLAVKAGFIGLTLAGCASLWLAVLADTGCSLLVVGNSLRLLRFRPPAASASPGGSPGETECHETHPGALPVGEPASAATGAAL